jgi:hypothetical protein
MFMPTPAKEATPEHASCAHAVSIAAQRAK